MENTVRIVEWSGNETSKTTMFYNGYKFSKHSVYSNAIRWRCTTCGVAVTTRGTEIVNSNDQLHKINCKKMLPVEAECVIKYEELKLKARGKFSN